MKKIKVLIMSVAILGGVGSAAIVRANTDCTLNTQYYLKGGAYLTAGTYGQDFYCTSSSNICSYVLSSGNYVACRQGDYTLINIVNGKEVLTKAK